MSLGFRLGGFSSVTDVPVSYFDASDVPVSSFDVSDVPVTSQVYSVMFLTLTAFQIGSRPSLRC